MKPSDNETAAETPLNGYKILRKKPSLVNYAA
jgi:hypothetical protein